MALRARLWPGLRTRSIWLDVVIALLGSGLIGLGTLGSRPASWSWPVVIAGSTVLTVLLMLLRRLRPLLPFLGSTPGRRDRANRTQAAILAHEAGLLEG